MWVEALIDVCKQKQYTTGKHFHHTLMGNMNMFVLHVQFFYSQTPFIRPFLIQLFAYPAKNIFEQIFPY